MRQRHPNSGDLRTVRVFLFLPETLDNETRWMEWARIEQVYVWSEYEKGWINVHWKD